MNKNEKKREKKYIKKEKRVTIKQLIKKEKKKKIYTFCRVLLVVWHSSGRQWATRGKLGGSYY